LRFGIFRSLAVIVAVGLLIVTLLYPFVFRAYIFDNIPRDWSLSDFKSFILVFSLIIAGLSACLFLVWPFVKFKKIRPDTKFMAAIILSFTVLISFTLFFFQQYNNDRMWITASYSSSTQQEIEMQSIGKVMAENEILGFHYRALFLKMFQWSFFPIALILPTLFLALRDLFLGKDIKLSLATSWLLLLAFLGFGFLLYG